MRAPMLITFPHIIVYTFFIEAFSNEEKPKKSMRSLSLIIFPSVIFDLHSLYKVG